MKNYVFIDSNIWIYSLISDSEEKFIKVRDFLKQCFKENIVLVSYQVINEVAANLKKKKFDEDKIREVIIKIEESCIVLDFTTDQLLKASELRENHLFSFWDSIIIASAIFGNSKILYSEDMQDGREIEGVRIVNPFK